MTERERNDRFKRAWFKRGMKVRYIGTQLAPYTGQVCTVAGWHGNGRAVGNGLLVMFPDGVTKSISYKMTEPVEAK